MLVTMKSLHHIMIPALKLHPSAIPIQQNCIKLNLKPMYTIIIIPETFDIKKARA